MSHAEDDRKTSIIARLGEYATIDAVAGYEQAMVARLRDDLQALVDEVTIDPFGNLVATKAGPEGAPTLMVAAHSDEIGAVVKAIEPDGMIRFERLGGVIETLLVGRAVRINGHRGVVGVRAGHISSPAERLQAPPISELYIDMGFESAADIERLGITIGDPIAYEAPMRQLANPDRYSGKALDNRVSCAILVELAHLLRDETLNCSLHLVSTVQEEVGLRGARIITYALKPSAAIVIDTMAAGGTPDVSTTKEMIAQIGHGPVVTLMSQGAREGIIVPPAMRDLLIDTAEREGIRYQLGHFFGSNSDAAAVHLVGSGVPTGVINIARRYSHSPVETLDINDVLGAFDLLAALIRNFGPDTKLDFL